MEQAVHSIVMGVKGNFTAAAPQNYPWGTEPTGRTEGVTPDVRHDDARNLRLHEVAVPQDAKVAIAPVSHALKSNGWHPVRDEDRSRLGKERDFVLRDLLDVQEYVCVGLKSASSFEPAFPGANGLKCKSFLSVWPPPGIKPLKKMGKRFVSFVPWQSTEIASQNSPPAMPKTLVGSIQRIE